MKHPPICYLDVDGVLYYQPKEEDFIKEPVPVALRPYIMALIQTIYESGYELRFLSCNPEGGDLILKALFESGYFPIRKTKYKKNTYYEQLDYSCVDSCFNCSSFFNGGDANLKTSYIDYSRDFIWIEDGIFDLEKEELRKRNILVNYCEVNPNNREELLKVIDWIKNHKFSKKETT